MRPEGLFNMLDTSTSRPEYTQKCKEYFSKQRHRIIAEIDSKQKLKQAFFKLRQR